MEACSAQRGWMGSAWRRSRSCSNPALWNPVPCCCPDCACLAHRLHRCRRCTHPDRFAAPGRCPRKQPGHRWPKLQRRQLRFSSFESPSPFEKLLLRTCDAECRRRSGFWTPGTQDRAAGICAMAIRLEPSRSCTGYEAIRMRRHYFSMSAVADKNQATRRRLQKRLAGFTVLAHRGCHHRSNARSRVGLV